MLLLCFIKIFPISSIFWNILSGIIIKLFTKLCYNVYNSRWSILLSPFLFLILVFYAFSLFSSIIILGVNHFITFSNNKILILRFFFILYLLSISSIFAHIFIILLLLSLAYLVFLEMDGCWNLWLFSFSCFLVYVFKVMNFPKRAVLALILC